jgi:aryl-alcohol dehydrogenase-like predicted oxidoreductase
VAAGEYDTLQVSYNLLRRDFAEQIFPSAQHANIGIIVKDGMARGMLAGKHADIVNEEERSRAAHFVRLAEKHTMPVHELALRFVLSHPAVSSVIIGTKNPEHLRGNAAAAAHGILPETFGSEL